MNHEDQVKQMLAQFDADQKRVEQGLPDDTIIRNSMRTPDGTEIVSTHRHDFVSHEDANGNTYSVDGGTAYLRRVGPMDAEDTSVFLWHGHAVVRDVFTWGTRGPDGDQPLKRVKLSEMSDDHMLNIINDGYNIWPLMQAELDWRKSAGARKLVRKADIERLQRLIEIRPEREEHYMAYAEPIITEFNNNEFD